MCRIEKFSVSARRCRCCRLRGRAVWQVVPRLCSCDAEDALSKLQASSRNLKLWPCGRTQNSSTGCEWGDRLQKICDVCRGIADDDEVDQEAQLELYTCLNWQPMQLNRRGWNMVTRTQAVHECHGSVEDALYWCDGRVRQPGEQSIAVGESRTNEVGGDVTTEQASDLS